MKMTITTEVEVQPFMTPNFIITVAPPRMKQDGFIEAPKIPVTDADPSLLSRLCDQFREDIFKKAGKKDPRLI